MFDHLGACLIGFGEDPRDPERLAALVGARVVLEDARTWMNDERTRFRRVPSTVPTETPLLVDSLGRENCQGIQSP
ncbi:MAG: hypothetical protein QNJ12_18255 [Ilumatobacter sp.]|uniref:hypothetical protein n=1 Tax=Ilumatobacter sp. TaxID=1967498 RepID=UPI002629CB50|nr:hypothetical protein [Ilumatobacter sp.]MDJ0770742.1 hypothetical protein [Ilumatobacter sp.]